MATNSKLVSYTKITHKKTSPRRYPIRKITIHHMAGNMSVETCGAQFSSGTETVSSNYGIGSDGRIALYVDEGDRAWTSANAENDHMAVNIEVANCTREPDWKISDKAMESLINLCVDICKRNGIECLNWTGDKTGNLTVHRFFRGTICPGPYLMERMPMIADEVNERLGLKPVSDVPAFKSYRVKIKSSKLNVRKGAGIQNSVFTTVSAGEVYTIVEEKDGWGRLKSGAGWIMLKYTEKMY